MSRDPENTSEQKKQNWFRQLIGKLFHFKQTMLSTLKGWFKSPRTGTRPKRSLRTILILWFIFFSVVPVAFVTGYSVMKYGQAIDGELTQRLIGNQRELISILDEFEQNISRSIRKHSSDKTLLYHLSKRSFSQVRARAKEMMYGSLAHKLAIFNREGRLEVAFHRSDNGEIKRRKKLESLNVYLSKKIKKDFKEENILKSIEFSPSKSMDLIILSKIQTSQGNLIGYIEEKIRFSHGFLKNIKKRLNIEVLFFSHDGSKIVSSHEDLGLYKNNFFLEQYNEFKGKIFDLPIRGEPYGFMLSPQKWGKNTFFVGIGTSKSFVNRILEQMNYLFFIIVGTIVFVSILFSFVISRILLKPLYELVSANENLDLSNPPIHLETKTDTELDVLIRSFNQMRQKTYESQRKQVDNIEELEVANRKIIEAQAQLVHSAKMSSLGQLVAGVAHELNNPIGFIYSNMGHLREYSEGLIHLVDVAENNVKSLEAEKLKVDFKYLVTDMPKLIKSCEDGAKRTRDIVLGLRNFSRLDEAKVKKVDIHEGIDETLKLLKGELKNRVEVVCKYGNIPNILCYPSQLNQVFMNILSNAAQSIPDQGVITITTESHKKDWIKISIKDTGKGMPSEVADKIFDPFYTTKMPGKGTGLGMSISYGVIQTHGGKISLRSKVGKGTEFYVELPIHLEGVS